jgi:hypothetical protein
MSISRLEVGYARGRRALRVWGLRATARESIRYVRRWPARQRWADLAEHEYGELYEPRHASVPE